GRRFGPASATAHLVGARSPLRGAIRPSGPYAAAAGPIAGGVPRRRPRTVFRRNPLEHASRSRCDPFTPHAAIRDGRDERIAHHRSGCLRATHRHVALTRAYTTINDRLSGSLSGPRNHRPAGFARESSGRVSAVAGPDGSPSRPPVSLRR